MRLALLSFALLGLALPASAQQLTTPRVSPHARVSQTVGMTELSVDYHRPAVNERRVWGDLVPYGEVWRAGANENTVFETSTDIRVSDQVLPAGRYGLHMIPGEDAWTVIFSTMSVAWGSYTYDPAEDALRIATGPRSGPHTERLLYRFDRPHLEGVMLIMAWDETEIEIPITVDTPAVVLAAMEAELRGVDGFYWQSWHQIAGYALDHGRRLDDALGWADRSIAIQETFANTMTKAALLDAHDRTAEAEAARDRAFTLATEDDVRAYARERRRAGYPAQADAVLARLDEIP